MLQDIIDTLTSYYDGFINYFTNVFISLKLFLVDIPVFILEKSTAFVVWLFNWIAGSCSYCFSGVDSLPYKIQAAFNSLSNSEWGNGVLYLLNQAGIPDCLRILTCGVVIWSVFKLLGFVKAVL